MPPVRIIPVSYTHLDVYKRQLWNLNEERVMDAICRRNQMKRFTDLVFCYPDARFEQMLLLMDKVADKRINYHIVINGELIIDN